MNRNFIWFFFFLFLIIVSGEASEFKFSTGLGGAHYRFSSEGSVSSEVSVTNLTGHVETEWLLHRFFLGAETVFPLFKEKNGETFSIPGTSLEGTSDFELESLSFDLFLGFELVDFFKPFVGLSYFRVSTEREARNPVFFMNESQVLENSADLLLGLTGQFDFTDYFFGGYSLKMASSGETDTEFGPMEFSNLDSFRLQGEIFFKLWLPDEISQIGLHFFGEDYSFDGDSSGIVPETELRSFGAFLSFQIQM